MTLPRDVSGGNGSPSAMAGRDLKQAIAYFDATVPRRERMRHRAQGGLQDANLVPAETASAAAGTAPPERAAAAPLARPPLAPPPAIQPVAKRAAAAPAPVTQVAAPKFAPPARAPVAEMLAKPPSQPVRTAAARRVGRTAGELTAFLVNFVVEQTGYPPEIIELDADLEADLGIDSIKKAQLFGELREYFDITPRDDLTLDDFPTLRHVLEFILESEGEPGPGASAPAAAGVPPPVAAAAPPQLTATTTVTTISVSANAAPPALAPARRSHEELQVFLVNFVVEQTGYPPEIVELDADLEADLGIDSIKKAQLFGELREYFDITPREDLTLDDFPTLRTVMEFILASAGAALAVPAPAPVSPVAAAKAPVPALSLPAAPAAIPARNPVEVAPAAVTTVGRSDAELQAFLVNFVVEQTGYPPEIVELDADLEADLGIDSIKKAQLFGELREYFDITPREDLTLDDFPTLRHVLEFIQANV